MKRSDAEHGSWFAYVFLRPEVNIRLQEPIWV